MKSSMMGVAVAVALAGCGTTDGMLTSTTRTVEYYRVFDIRTAAAAPAVAQAASDGIGRNVRNATLATPAPAVTEVQDVPGRFRMPDVSSAAPGTAVERGPTCEGASWTAKATPKVTGSDELSMVACLFPYKNGYHLDMYAVFTKKEGGWLQLPRRMGGALMGTPEKWTEKAMLDVVRAIRGSTGAEVALLEAKPEISGAPWLDTSGSAAPPPAK